MATRRFRRRWLWLLLPLAALGGFLVLRALLQPERVTAFLLRQAEQATGLSLSLSQPADIGIWPDLHLELIGLTATAPGAASPLLQVQRVEVALPWSALRSETLQMQHLALVAPTLDLPALQAWLAADDDSGPPAPLRLPQFDAAFEIEDGAVNADGWSLQDLSLALPALRGGAPTTLVASGSYVTADAAHGFDVRIDTTPVFGDFDIALAPLVIDMSVTPLGDTRLRLAGELHYGVPDALRFGLATELAAWPADWPVLPLPAASAAAPVAMRIDFAGTTALQGEVDLHLSRGEDTIAGRIDVGDLPAWLADEDRPLLPPLLGEMTAPRIVLDDIEAIGVSVRITDDAAETAPATDKAAEATKPPTGTDAKR